jgi:hypothetical protein
MKTPGISSLWISPIYDGKQDKISALKSALKSAYLSLPSSNLTYYTHTQTWDRLIHILTKESKLKESSSYFSFLYLWGEGEGKEVSSPRLVPTPNFLLACW